MPERRRFERHAIQVPVAIRTRVRRNRVGVSRDLSASGVLFHSVSRFEIGERVAVRFRVGRDEGVTAGRVVRADVDDRLHGPFRHVTAVRFDAPLIDLPL